MAKVDWITWKTDTSEIINKDVILDKINDIFKYYNHNINSIIYEDLNYEITNGGLDHDSLNIYGISPAYESATKITSSIENIRETIEKIKQKVAISVEEQKEIEKNQLIEAIEKKIQEEKRILENTNILKDKVSISNNTLNIEEVVNIIDITKERIRKLEERLEKAKSL